MARLTDGKKTVDITMNEWTGSEYTPDWSNDFFQVGCLSRNEDLDAYIVPDVDYCIDQANDWKNGVGDFLEDEDVNTEDRNVDVEEV